MADLFELAIALKAAGADEVLKALKDIERQGNKAADTMTDGEQRLRKEVNERIRAFEKLGQTVNRESIIAVRAYQSEARALEAYTRGIALTADEQLRLERAMTRVERIGNVTENRFESAAKAGVQGFSQITSASGDAAKGMGGLLTAAESVAWSLGKQGPVVAAAFALGGVLVAMWNQSKEAAKQATEDMQRRVEHLAQLARTHPGAVAGMAADTTLERSEVRLRADVAAAERTMRESAQGSGDWIAAWEKWKKAKDDLAVVLREGVAPLLAQASLATEEFVKATEDSTDAINREVAAIRALHEAHLATAADYARARQLEALLTAEMEAGNATRERRAQLAGELAMLSGVAPRGAIAAPAAGGLTNLAPMGVWGDVPGTSFRPKRVSESVAETVLEAQGALIKARYVLASTIADHFGAGLKNAVADAFAEAFSGGGLRGLFESFTRGILRSLGQMFIAVGKEMVKFGAIMKAIQDAIMSALAFSGPAAIVGGLALIALGGALTGMAGGIGAGGGGYGGGGGGASSGGWYGGGAGAGGGGGAIPTRYIVPGVASAQGAASMQARPAVTVNVSAFGHFTPADVRKLAENVEEAIERRMIRPLAGG